VLDFVGKFLFRGPQLHHLRIRQYIRYFAADQEEEAAQDELDDAGAASHAATVADPPHGRYFDAWAFAQTAGTKCKSTVMGCSVVRRHTFRLGIGRTFHPEPVGSSRDDFYQLRLLECFPWRVVRWGEKAWTLVADLPDGLAVASSSQFGAATFTASASQLRLTVSRERRPLFEDVCAGLENFLLPAACACCAGDSGSMCARCSLAVGIHTCIRNAGNGAFSTDCYRGRARADRCAVPAVSGSPPLLQTDVAAAFVA
jgi:hypothetical protein